jgi:hypothetical protein
MTDVRASGLARDEAQKLALLNAAEAAVADAKEKAINRRQSRAGKATRTVAISFGLVIFGFAIYLLVARPPWFFTPPPPPETVAIQEASLRLMLVREADRLKRYRAQHGKLPSTLEQAGSPVHGVLYQTSNDSTFRLIAAFGGETIGLSSTDSVGAFLGNSLKVIASRGRP